jgi:DNA-binding CsgD family transcriptional regulator
VLRAESAAAGTLEPRDELYRQALHVGLARRDSDVPELVRTWVRAREAILRHPVDLFALLPLGELMIAGARLDDDDRLAPHVAAATTLLARLGEPALWATPLHWSGAQAAIMTDDPERLRPHAAALVAAARTSPYAAILASDRTVLLQCARALTEAHGIDEAPAPDPSAATEAEPHACGHLSDRERDVARLVVAGQTYREIGGRLFISAKTVEHHVARIRQRLGASNRSDLLARLRAELAEEV